jgi:pimeloyl-ACP methyl ester carboxylesterase
MDVLPAPRLEGAFSLADGRRKIGFAEYGDPDGKTIFWFHGTPGGRRQISPGARVAAQEMGVRLFVLERPGIGESTAHLYRNLAEWADDVLHIADGLGVDKFACVGLSGGGPYVLACAAKAPDRMVAGAILGSVAPTVGADAAEGGVVGFARRFAPLLTVGRGAMARALHLFVKLASPIRSQAFDLYMAMSPEGDKRVFRRPEMKAMFIDDLLQASMYQAQAPLLDLILFTRDWGFSLADIRVPIRMWHGDHDNIVPIAHALHLSTRIPDCNLHIRHGESHLGALDAAEEIFSELLAFWVGSGPEDTRRRLRSEGSGGKIAPVETTVRDLA